MKLLDLTLATPAANLAGDEALLNSAEAGRGGEILRFWEPQECFVVVGYANQVETEVKVAACTAGKIPIFRRCSGGGTVLQGPGCLNYALILQITNHPPLTSISGANQFIMERNRSAIESEVRSRMPDAGITVQGHTDLTLVTRHPSPVTLFVGTHALFTAGFDLPKLGLVIIDEQHKFGVAQRETLVRKGNYPHLLVMTATPIPRTLGLTLYGDLDVSVIDEMPGGRGRVKTFVRAAEKLPKVWEFIREKIVAGRQAYVVYPRVEEQDTANDIKAVTKEFENVQRALAPFKVGLLHGRVKSADKESVMAAFRANQIQALVATALIEVGVDVPNATVMLIENAERFGLAQLHQLRGRIGRGAHESFCILISDAKSDEARERLKILEETNDGFKIAEADLKLRGPGELLGREQSGMPKFRFGNLTEDLDLIRQARELVRQQS